MRNNCFVFPDIFFRNVANSIKCEKNITPPPPPPIEIQNQNKGIEDIMDIDSNCPYLLPVFGETTSHLTSKLNVMDGRTDGRTDRQGGSIIFNVENSIKRERIYIFHLLNLIVIITKKIFLIFFTCHILLYIFHLINLDAASKNPWS